MAASKRDIKEQLQGLWERLEPYGLLHTFHRHTFIYTPTHPARSFYLLQSGQISLQMLSSVGRVLMLKVIEPGQMFGHSVLVGNTNYDTFAEAIKTVQVYVVPQMAVWHVLAEQPVLSLALIEALGQHYMMVSRRLDEVAFKSVPARLASLLLDMADVTIDEPQLRLPRRTHQQLAEMINAYRETVTKVLHQFQAAQLLNCDRTGITLLNMPRLRELAQR